VLGARQHERRAAAAAGVSPVGMPARAGARPAVKSGDSVLPA
jgi:hypothetical protein